MRGRPRSCSDSSSPMRSPMSSPSFAVRSLPRSTVRPSERMAVWCDRLASRARHSRCAHRGKTRILDQPFQVLAVDRHPIKRGRFFAGGLSQKQNIVVVDPATVPAEECFPRDAHRLLRRDFKYPQSCSPRIFRRSQTRRECSPAKWREKSGRQFSSRRFHSHLHPNRVVALKSDVTFAGSRSSRRGKEKSQDEAADFRPPHFAPIFMAMPA